MDNRCPQYILEIINRILLLQRQEFDSDINGCDRPFLGPTPVNDVYNTRPIQLYNAYTAEPWSFNVTLNGTTSVSNTFRIEDVEQCNVTIRLLILDEISGLYINTNQFVIIDLATIGAIRCLPDTYVSL